MYDFFSITIFFKGLSNLIFKPKKATTQAAYLLYMINLFLQLQAQIKQAPYSGWAYQCVLAGNLWQD